ncbi:MAG: ATP-binding protein [Lachnospiraceae bacterium]|nr:ATP-binding protein [Lachnospiraceae bacterium]
MEVIIVCGAPASGKTTYVKKNMTTGDLVIDLDAIRCAIGFVQGKTPVDNLLPVVIELRDHLYEMIAGGKIDAPRCWIIAGLPKVSDRAALAARFGAKIVFMDITEEECIRRATDDPEREDKLLQAEIITNYFTEANADRGIKKNRGNAAARNIATLFKDIDD